MRALLLLSIVVVAFLALRWFSPGPAQASPGLESGPESTPDSMERETGEVRPSEAGVRFLPAPVEPAGPVPAAVADPASSAAAPEEAWPARLVAETLGQRDELQAAAALVHGTPAEVQAAAGGLPQDRALLVESFAWAVAGERQVAISLSARMDRDAVQGHERALLEAALTGKTPAPAGSSSGPMALAMEMALVAREARVALAEKRFPAAASAFSSLLVSELGAPWAADSRVLASWTEGLDAAQREHRWSPRGEWPSVELLVQEGDSLIGVRKRYLSEQPAALMCAGLIERANRVRGYLQPGQKLRVPTDPVRVLVDLDARWALYFLGDEVAASWPVGVGRPGEDTPPGDYVAIEKTENPPWMKVGQEPIPFGDPRNPLGTRWIGWARDGVKTSYGFHGTSDPGSIGQAASDGCVRFLNEDVEELFQILPEGAPIRVEG